ncbi:hypothetical protein [Mesorhizobium sp. M0228]|uniref:hypothetical protein n=1 Tax=Mesorhizobium sp. M0228 TaxID=2956923 RepID=UPI00333A90E5
MPDPEPQLPDWNLEYFEPKGEMPEALAALHEHRKMRRDWEAAKTDQIEAALELGGLETRFRLQRQRRIAPADKDQRPSSRKDRRAAILRTWHKNGWIDADTVPVIASVRFDQKRDLRPGRCDHDERGASLGRPRLSQPPLPTDMDGKPLRSMAIRVTRMP